MILGIDEAGRGSVIGPMVIAGVLIDQAKLGALRKIGVRDSKELSPARRQELAKKIKQLAHDWIAIKISATKIDQLRKRKNLNLIEAEHMAQIIRTMRPDTAYIDAPQVSVEKFKALLAQLTKGVKLICANYAEKKYKVVAAASILAKVERDHEIEKIKKKVNFDFGVGYPHDPRSIAFVKLCLKEHKHLDYIRRSWATVRQLTQKKLSEY